MNEDNKINSNIRRLTNPPNHHFFGYYGINPWDSNGEFHLALETDFHSLGIVYPILIGNLLLRYLSHLILWMRWVLLNLQMANRISFH